jgi:prepilin signal peptidase PulO-like enzyme (type II secretory pathway)
MEHLQIALLHAIFGGYSFFLGATIGSFLNVVVYRMPRGINIVRPRSRCPVCATPIALQDNIPVLSWLVLRGRCRWCATPISPRYLLVELTVGLLFLALFYVEVLTDGANLPFRTRKSFHGLLTIHWESLWDSLRIALFHAWLLVTLLAAALIRIDGLPVPRRLWLWPLAGGLLLPVVWSDLRPTASAELMREIHAVVPMHEIQVGAGIYGCLIGAALGWGLGLSRSDSRPLVVRHFSALRTFRGARVSDYDPMRQQLAGPDELALLSAMAIVGTMLGWQPAMTVACLAAIGLIGQAMLERIRGQRFADTAVAWVLLAVAAYIPFWKWWALESSGPGYRTGPFAALGWFGAMVAMSLAGRALRAKRQI